LIKEKHPDIWLIEYASIGEKLNNNEYGAFTKNGLITYLLSNEKKLIKTGEISWPTEKNGEWTILRLNLFLTLTVSNSLQEIMGKKRKNF
jgi:hypothetical protein